MQKATNSSRSTLISQPLALRPLRLTLCSWLLAFLPFGYLWLLAVNNLRVEWTENPQYSYGWVVPLLCLGLAWRKWHWMQGDRGESAQRLQARGTEHERGGEGQNSAIDDRESPISSLNAEGKGQKTETADGRIRNPQFRGSVLCPPSSVLRLLSSVFLFLFALLAFLILPTRLLEEAAPEWRVISWLLALEAVGLTLLAGWLLLGTSRLAHLAFPVAFFLVAVPWLRPLEGPVIRSLTHANATMVIEVLSWLGVPALQHGNTIEVGAGIVGLDEACSGIRSFQSSLMISLFLGEFYRLTVLRRTVLCLGGFALAIFFNVCRTTLLTWVAAKKGVGAIADYHDPAGVSIAIACLVGLWLLALLLKRTNLIERPPLVADPPSNPQSAIRNPPSSGSVLPALSSVLRAPFSRLALALLVWLLLVEIGTALWYKAVESKLEPGPQWTVVWPTDNPTLHEVPFASRTQGVLKSDEQHRAAWETPPGIKWSAFFLRWYPGKTAGYLARRHTPEACFAGAGMKLRAASELRIADVRGVRLPYQMFSFDNDGQTLYVFYCRYEEGMKPEAYVTERLRLHNTIRAVWAGRGNRGQKVLEIVVNGFTDMPQAEAAVLEQLQQLIKVGSLGDASPVARLDSMSR